MNKFNPIDKTIDPITWKPSKELWSVALKRCSWINNPEFLLLNTESSEESFLATVIVSCYFQGLADGVKHMAHKQRQSARKEN